MIFNSANKNLVSIRVYGHPDSLSTGTVVRIAESQNSTTHYGMMRGHKHYELSNLPIAIGMGNVLVVITDQKHATCQADTVTHYTAQVTSATDYSPFGAPLAGRTWYGDMSGRYRFGFNGMEKIDEVSGVGNFIDYGARVRDPRVGPWLSTDPLQAKYPYASPYNYTLNNPIYFIDPDGKVVIPVHGTWSSSVQAWKNLPGIYKASQNLFNDNRPGEAYDWSGANYAELRTKAAIGLINHVRTQMQSEDFNGKITLVGHSHGGNVSIEALNMMAEMEEFNNVELNLLTINTPVREDYQLSEKARGRVNHVNVYDSKDPVQSRGGNSTVILPDLPRTPDFMDANTKGTGEYGSAGRTFEGAKNISVDNPQGVTGDFHNSHNRTDDWVDKTKKK